MQFITQNKRRNEVSIDHTVSFFSPLAKRRKKEDLPFQATVDYPAVSLQLFFSYFLGLLEVWVMIDSGGAKWFVHSSKKETEKNDVTSALSIYVSCLPPCRSCVCVCCSPFWPIPLQTYIALPRLCLSYTCYHLHALSLGLTILNGVVETAVVVRPI